MKQITFNSLVKIKWLQETIDYIVKKHNGILCDDLMYKKIIEPCSDDESYEKLTTLLVEILNKYLTKDMGYCMRCAENVEGDIKYLEDILEKEPNNRP